jgi:glycosyltransferase involved in cell wall biosynthesis
MKSVLIDARESGTSTGRYIDKLIEHLAKLNPSLKVMVITKSHRIKHFNMVAPNFQIIRSDIKEFTFKEQLGLLKQIWLLKPDLVHFGMVQQPIFYPGLVVTTIHDLTTLRFNNPDKNPVIFKFKQRVYKEVVKIALKKSKVIITPSIYTKSDLDQFSEINISKIKVVYEAADKIMVPAKKIKILENKPYIFYVGRPTPHKNLNRLIDAFGLVLKKRPDLSLVLAGRLDANYRRLEEYVKKQRVQNVIFLGFVEDGELKWLYENTLSYVFPSLSEGFGLPSLEAMVLGAPVVSSNATCLPEINGDAALYFDPLSVLDMSEKILMMVNEKALRTKYIKLGQVQAAKYSWDKTAKETLAVYQQVLGVI